MSFPYIDRQSNRPHSGPSPDREQPMLHVIHIIDDLRVGGAQRLLLTFTEEASSRGIRTTVITLQDDLTSSIARNLEAAGADLVACPAKGKHRLLDSQRFLTLIHQLRNSKGHIVHTHLTYSNILGTLAARLTGMPVVNTLHGLITELSARAIKISLEFKVLNHFSNRVIAVGGKVAECHQTYLPRQQIANVPNAIHAIAPITLQQREWIRNVLMGDAHGTLILSLGRLTEEKGFPDLLRAFKKVRSKRPDCALAIIGDDTGSYASVIKAELLSLELEGHAFLLPPRDEVHALLGAADLYVCSSHSEGLPLSLLEAMSAGVPVIATAVGAIPEVITQNNGTLIPSENVEAMAEAILGILSEPKTAAMKALEAQRTIAQSFDVGVWFRQLLEIYGEVHLA